MPFFVMKSGLEIFDVARAYGLAVFLDTVTPEETSPLILDNGHFYLIQVDKDVSLRSFAKQTTWTSLFEEIPQDRTWSRVFLTDKQNWKAKVNKTKSVLEHKAKDILDNFSSPGFFPDFSASGETMPGPLDPSAFKGLHGRTRRDYAEGQTKVDSQNWALACLGAAVAGRYRIQKSTGNKWDYYVFFPVPERFELRNFREVRDKTKGRGLQYLGVQNAAAHFSVVLADTLRAMAASRISFQDRFSNLLYFSLFQASQHQFKPAAGGFLNLHPLVDLAISKPKEAEKVFAVWSYLFRRGSVQGCEDLAHAITALIMRPTLETYETHAKVFLRCVVRQEVKYEHLYESEPLKEVLRYVEA